MTWRCSGFQEFRSSIENAVVRKVDDFENNGQLNFFMNLFFIEPQVKKKSTRQYLILFVHAIRTSILLSVVPNQDILFSKNKNKIK